ncbi:hypothetical protein QJQ45_018798, partial [Haematococcus lacustris]
MLNALMPVAPEQPRAAKITCGEAAVGLFAGYQQQPPPPRPFSMLSRKVGKPTSRVSSCGEAAVGLFAGYQQQPPPPRPFSMLSRKVGKPTSRVSCVQQQADLLLNKQHVEKQQLAYLQVISNNHPLPDPSPSGVPNMGSCSSMGIYISSTVSMLRVWAHARDAVSQLLERQKDRSPPWAVTLSQLLQDNSLLLRLTTERQQQLQQQQADLHRREQNLTERQHQLQQQQADLNSREQQQARIQ